MRGRLFVVALIVAGIGLTGASIVTRVKATKNQPRIVYDILQQSCGTWDLDDPIHKADGIIPSTLDRSC